MKTISGGLAPGGTYMSCANANGGTTLLYVKYPLGDKQIGAAVDEFNGNPEVSPIVGCDVPS